MLAYGVWVNDFTQSCNQILIHYKSHNEYGEGEENADNAMASLEESTSHIVEWGDFQKIHIAYRETQNLGVRFENSSTI